MATRKQKQPKAAQPVNAYASIVATQHKVMVETFVGWASNAIDAQDKRHNAADAMLQSIVTLRGAAPDVPAYLSTIVDEFGNGQKGKDRKPGRIYDAVQSALVGKGDRFKTERTWSTQLTMARKVAMRLADPVQFARMGGSEPPAFRTLYDEAKTSRAPAVKAEDATQPSGLKDITLNGETPIDILEQIVARVGLSRYLMAASNVLATKLSTKTEAASIRALAEKFGAGLGVKFA